MTGKSLKDIALLNLIAQLYQQSARLILAFLLPPFFLNYLGSDRYGLWVTLLQALTWLSICDFRPIPTTKMLLSIAHLRADDNECRRILASGLLLTVITLPIFLLSYYLFWRILPSLISFETLSEQEVLATLIILGIGLLVDRIVALPGNVLRGVNQEFVGASIASSIILISGGLSALAIYLGYGLVGLAYCFVFEKLLTAGYLWVKALRRVSWLGLAKPKNGEFLYFCKVAFLGTLTSVGNFLLSATDLIFAGLLFGPSFAASYSITSTLSRWGNQLLGNVSSSAGAGLAGLCGNSEWSRLVGARNELLKHSLLIAASTSILVVGVNSRFVQHWTGVEMYLGPFTTLNLLFSFIFYSLARLDALLLDCFIELKAKLSIQIFSAASCFLTLYLVWADLGIDALAFAYMLGNFVFLCLNRIRVEDILAQRLGKTKEALSMVGLRGLMWTLISVFLASIGYVKLAQDLGIVGILALLLVIVISNALLCIGYSEVLVVCKKFGHNLIWRLKKNA